MVTVSLGANIQPVSRLPISSVLKAPTVNMCVFIWFESLLCIDKRRVSDCFVQFVSCNTPVDDFNRDGRMETCTAVVIEGFVDVPPPPEPLHPDSNRNTATVVTVR